MIDRLVAAAGPGCGVMELASAWSNGGQRLPDWPQFRFGWVTPTHRGRTAIRLICDLWKLGPGDDVLVPAYNCGTEIDPIVGCGARVVPYRIDENMRFCTQEVEQRITPRTKMVYVTHYFGWSHDIDELAAWCRDRCIKVVEDCALRFFREPESEGAPLVSDAAIFSFPKWFAVPDGGALVLRERPDMEIRLDRKPRALRIARNIAMLMKRRVMGGNRLPWRSGRQPALNGAHCSSGLTSGEELPDMPAEYYYDSRKHHCRISTASLRLLHRIQPGTVARRRQANYRCLQSLLTGVAGVTLVFQNLPSEVCPLGLPVLVQERPRWIESLHTRGVEAIPWWAGYHRALDWQPFPEARRLKDHVMVLPVHQDLNEEHMESIARQVRTVASEL
ncbi:MAG: aminotransferase class V-fold PLP-dependent enzyme [Planctomycetota bacterium]|nr:aminotransferase class V-fold PLP-dependent enzyme [Planctomycetota bacterium]